ncbi:MAG TPA: hypothetical protein VFR47_28245 [Anaerolineales bacterium]|nr:hypothetical protein [Anaerolineales bacterium]
MRRRQRHSFLRTLTLMGLVLPGLIGIFVVQAKAIADQTLKTQLMLQAAATSTPTLTSTSTPPLFPTSTGLSLTNPASLLASSLDLYAFIQAPTGPVSRPYVTLIAFGSVARSGSVVIRGFINSDEFICTESPCVIYLQSSSRLVFRAYADTGESSDEVIASVSVVQVEGGFLVTIDAVSQFTPFTDSCAAIWRVRDEENASWDNFVQFPFELNTDKTLHFLATKLILNGIVDARDCPAGGLSLSLDWPTGCGLEKARSAMIAWQNQFDEYIWLASRNHGIPPKLLKTLIDYESQFWPGNSRFYLDEYGLAQINQLGVDVLLRRDPTHYQRVCASAQLDCTRPYASLDPEQQRLIRGLVISSIDASCPTCDYGVDLDRAKQSIDLIASLLQANCQQVDAIRKQAVEPDPDADAATATAAVATIEAGGSSGATTYEDLWRFTLLAYHSGSNCFREAYVAMRRGGGAVNWENLANSVACKGGEPYVEGLMDNLFAFDSYLYQPSEALPGLAVPTIVPTRTPVPTPTVYISSARIIVKVYVDRNANGTPEEGEWVDAMTVRVTVSNRQEITQRTQNGIAIFDMSGYTPNSGIDVSLPGLYRNQTFLLPEEGDVEVIFKFDQPVLPTSLP